MEQTQGTSAVVVVRRVALAGLVLVGLPLLRGVPGPIDARGPAWQAAADAATVTGLALLLVALAAWVLRLLLLEHADRVVRGLRGEEAPSGSTAEVLVDLLREDREVRRSAAAATPFVDDAHADERWRRPASEA